MCHVSHACSSTTSQTQPRTMSDSDICSNDKKYGGFGAMMTNLLHHQEERELCAAHSYSVFAPNPAAVAAVRVPVSKNPPPVTLIDESKTSSGKRVANDIMLATARAPAKKGAPSASAPDVAPAPVFLEDPQVTAAVKAKIHPPVHAQKSGCRVVTWYY